nr:uncharacterized protein LOC109744859 [Aegilops tauschii subsp. strangulata]
MSSIPQEDVQHTSSLARQVFPEVIPSESAHESEAKTAEDILVASADEEREEERDVIPLASDPVVQEEGVIVPDPHVHEAMEVEANEAATTNTTKANDTVMVDDNVEPEVNAATAENAQPTTSDVVGPPPVPHTMERAYNRGGELVTVRERHSGVQAHNDAKKGKALWRPGIDPKLAAKKKKKPAEAKLEAPRQERPSIIFPTSMIGSKPKVPSAASDQKKTRQAEAEARKRKHHETSEAAPSKKKLKTKSSCQEHAAAQEPLNIEPISVALPASMNRECRLVVLEPASTEAPESEEIPAANSTAVEDMGHKDHVEDDEVLPQLEPKPALTEMYSMPNGEQEQDPEGEASGGESGEWHSDGEGDEESDDLSDEEEVDSPPRRERRSKLTHDPASGRDKAIVQTGQSSKLPRMSSPAPTEKAPKQSKVVVQKTRKALPKIKIDILVASAAATSGTSAYKNEDEDMEDAVTSNPVPLNIIDLLDDDEDEPQRPLGRRNRKKSAEKMNQALAKKDQDLAAAQKAADEKTTLAEQKLASVGKLEEENTRLKTALDEANKEATRLKKEKNHLNEKMEGIAQRRV